MKKVYLLLLLLLLLVPFSVFADCNDCAYPNCSDCGCVPSSNGENKCVYNNIDNNVTFKSCGDNLLTNIPPTVTDITKLVYNIVQVVVPIVLVLFGSLDLVKAIIAGKEDDIKKHQRTFIKRLISAVIIFFIFSAVKLVVSLSADNSEGIIKCAECFISGVCK